MSFKLRTTIVFTLFIISNIAFGQTKHTNKIPSVVVSIVENFLVDSSGRNYSELVKNKTYILYKIEDVLYEHHYQSDSIEIYTFGDGTSEIGWSYLLFKYKTGRSYFIIGQYPKMEDNLFKLVDVLDEVKAISGESVKTFYGSIIENYNFDYFYKTPVISKDTVGGK